MKVLLVNGSPNEHGCTDRALQEVKTALEAEGVGADIYWIDNAPIPGCLSCMYCVKNHKCVYDDLVNSFVNIAKHYDGFVFGSPVYFASAAGQMVAFMDRVFFSSYAGKTDTFYMKPVASVASCRRAGDVAALDQLNKYYGLMHMPVVSSSYWNEVHGHKPSEVVQDLEGMQTMRNLGKNMAWLLKCIDAGRENGVKDPERPAKPDMTNFIRK